MSVAPQIKGWCPSAWRPMLTGDGYLVRLRFFCGIVTSDQARTIAGLSQRYGNGLIDLTRRANLQIRGVSEECIPELQAQLVAEGLIAEDAASEATPNVIASPLAGRDPEALMDITPMVRQLERAFARDPCTRDLPAKFCIAFNDGGRFSLRGLDADIAFEARQADQFAVRIADASVGLVERDQVANAALALAAAFTSLRERIPGIPCRMHDLDGLAVGSLVASCPAMGLVRTLSSDADDHVDGRAKPGHDAVGWIEPNVFGVAAAFGSLSADQLQLLADLSERYAEGELRLTPWRSILLPGTIPAALDRLEVDCARAGLLTDAAHPRRHIAACVGAPACASASVETRSVAAALAPLLREQDTLHISGCTKGCASSRSASVTLVGRDGRYDLVRSGKASDSPGLFGLTAEDAGAAIERMGAEDLAHV